MGEVYRARDARLNHDVAIKVLPESLANDAGRPRSMPKVSSPRTRPSPGPSIASHDVAAGTIRQPDGRTLYYGARQVEANVWKVEQPREVEK